ncbi:unnamed protein product [Calypogeia fissa]
MAVPYSAVPQGLNGIPAEEQAAIKWLEENLRGDVDDLRFRLGHKSFQSSAPNPASQGRNRESDHTDPFGQVRAAWDLGRNDVEQRIVNRIMELLKLVQTNGGKEIRDLYKRDMTVMHLVAFVGLLGLMEMLSTRPHFLQQVNVPNSEGRTPLHLASLTGSAATVKFLSGLDMVRADLEDNSEQTAFEIADEMKRHEIVKVLFTRTDVKDYLKKKRAERTMYGDGTNAILVGAALIASITFAGWEYVDISEHLAVKVFWVANSLSFYFAIASILAGAGAMVPRRGLGELAEVKRKRGAVYLTGFVFSWAVVFVVAAFTAAGFASLPPIFSYEAYIISTLLVGCAVCIYGFSSARMTDPSVLLNYLKIIDPAWYVSKLSVFFERCCRQCGYQSSESRIQQRERRYNFAPDSL